MTERIKGKPYKIKFRVTPKQVKVAEILSQYPEDERVTRKAMRVALQAAGISDSTQNVSLYMKRKSNYELAKCIADGVPYELRMIESSFNVEEQTQIPLPALEWTNVLEKFCWEMACDSAESVNRAADRAGLEREYASKLCSQYPIVWTRIKEIQAERLQRYKPVADKILQRLMVLSSASFNDLIKEVDKEGNIVFKNFSTLSPDELFAIQQISRTRTGAGKLMSTTYKIKIEDRKGPLALLAKHLGLLDTEAAVDPRELVEGVRKFASGLEEFVPGGEL